MLQLAVILPRSGRKVHPKKVPPLSTRRRDRLRTPDSRLQRCHFPPVARLSSGFRSSPSPLSSLDLIIYSPFSHIFPHWNAGLLSQVPPRELLPRSNPAPVTAVTRQQSPQRERVSFVTAKKRSEERGRSIITRLSLFLFFLSNYPPVAPSLGPLDQSHVSRVSSGPPGSDLNYFPLRLLLQTSQSFSPAISYPILPNT